MTNTLEKCTEKDNEKEQNSPSNKPNCFILGGSHIKELRISQKNVGSKDKTAFDKDWGWCFYEKKDAEKIAEKHSKQDKKIKVIPFFSEIARRKWHGTKLEKKSVGLETRYHISKQDIDDEEKRIRDICNKKEFDFSFLYENTHPESFSGLQKKTFDFLKPQFEKWKNEQQTCKELYKELLDLEEKIKDEKEGTFTNPNDWPFKVLGYNNKREILLWHQGDLMLIPVKQLSKKDLQLLMGTSIDAEEAIIEEAHRKGKIYDDKPLKAGVWKIKNKWLVISGKQAAVISEKGVLTDLKEPIFEGKIIEFENNDWLDWDHFKNSYGNVKLENVYNKILSQVSSWNWLEPSMSKYATAFVLLSPMQQAMSWRPWLYLTGAKGTGKSTFFESVIQEIYGNMAERLDKTTAHATAQTIGNTGKIPIFDEFEKYGHVSHVLELAKGFNKGGKKTSGTPGPNAHKYDLHHLAWFGSIYPPKQISDDSAQESRIVKLELKKLKNATPLLEKIEEGSKMAAEIVASLIFEWKKIEQEAKSITQRRIEIMQRLPGTEIRTVDNFMYASAILNLSTKEIHDVPDWKNSASEDDGEKVLSSILSSRVRVKDNEFRMISELVKLTEKGDGYTRSLLQQNGLSIKTTKEGQTFLAIRPKEVIKFLLKDDEYFKFLDISAPLGRIEGSEKNVNVSFGSQGSPKCIIIPIHYVNSICGFEQTGNKPQEKSNGGNGEVMDKVTPYLTNNYIVKDDHYHHYQENDDELQTEFSFSNENN